MEEQSRQTRYLVLIAAALCAVIIGYNAFYVPDAPLTEPAVTADQSSAQPEEYAPSSVPPSVRPASGAGSAASPRGGAEKININTATAEELSEKLKGIGSGLAERIVAYRGQHGPFRSIEQLKDVSGIGDKKFESIRSFVTVG